MKSKFLIITFMASVMFVWYSCSDGSLSNPTPKTASKKSVTKKAPADDKNRGIGKFTDVKLTHPLDDKMVAEGQVIYDVKCQSCHKLTADRVVGPGWRGVTDRRTPEWIMNFATNVDEMLDKDPEAIAMMEICLMRMPNQNLSDDEARNVLEFMRKNDGKN